MKALKILALVAAFSAISVPAYAATDTVENGVFSNEKVSMTVEKSHKNIAVYDRSSLQIGEDEKVVQKAKRKKNPSEKPRG